MAIPWKFPTCLHGFVCGVCNIREKGLPMGRWTHIFSSSLRESNMAMENSMKYTTNGDIKWFECEHHPGIFQQAKFDYQRVGKNKPWISTNQTKLCRVSPSSILSFGLQLQPSLRFQHFATLHPLGDATHRGELDCFAAADQLGNGTLHQAELILVSLIFTYNLQWWLATTQYIYM